MEKDQKINTDSKIQSDDVEKDNIEGKIPETEHDSKEQEEEVKEITPEEKIKDLEDKVTRTFAEMENQRRRFEKEREDAFDYGGFAFAKEALSLIDNLERSKNILENDEILKNTEALKKTLEHFDIINKDLMSIFSKNNIKPINSIGEKLNPNHHQAMMEIEDDDKEPGVIIQEIQKGYMMKDRLLRPSLVGVAKKSSKKDEKPSKNQPELKD
ncbi:nucleotide exchange factor GrpE [Candidatus Pelagibacter sp.]|nr:nucleotide exchange factor GrpE [Candidatus Pelagibacter sp.]|tara:strand:+ start:350 stop:988 length:639 start_codon:yes stop_codon:yes gene_type:complete